MLKCVLAIVGAAALTVGTAASAAVTVNGSTGVNTGPTFTNNPTMSTIVWGQTSEPSGSFAGDVTFSNALSGLYSIIVSTSTPGAYITNITLTGPTGSAASDAGFTSEVWSTPAGAMSTSPGSLTLTVPFSGLGDYSLSFAGTAPPNGGAASGNLTFIAAVPEASTWMMMLLGFGAIGAALRTRRRPAFAQVA